jgi:hypothetical protein
MRETRTVAPNRDVGATDIDIAVSPFLWPRKGGKSAAEYARCESSENINGWCLLVPRRSRKAIGARLPHTGIKYIKD